MLSDFFLHAYLDVNLYMWQSLASVANVLAAYGMSFVCIKEQTAYSIFSSDLAG